MPRFAAAALIALAFACGSDKPAPCSAPPTFTRDVFPIVQMKCLPCHSSTKTGESRMGAPPGLDFDTYDATMPNQARFADAITSGLEPPMSVPQLATTAEERDLVSDWRRCSYPR
jgi:uncharacterized membrane protein